MARKMSDCRRFPSETNCTLVIVGEEMEVIQAAAEHAVTTHDAADGQELREQIRDLLEPEAEFQPGTRQQEPLPGGLG